MPASTPASMPASTPATTPDRLPAPQSARTTRRRFLTDSISTGLLASAGVAAATSAHRHRTPSPEPRTILVLGGTNFLGPAIVEAALARGHRLTLFNRGRTNPHLFPDVEKLQGNRRRPMREGMPAQDLSALEGRRWDAVVDTSGYFTGEVEDMARLLADAVAHYTFVSSLSVYPELGLTNTPIDEETPVGTLEDKYTTQMTEQSYGPLKAYCEAAVEAALPGKALRVRPGYIVGPRDNSDRFTYWPKRLVRGGEILAPGARDAEQQLIDVRDLGAWIVHAIEQRTVGVFNAVGYKGRISTQELLHTGKGTLNDECSFTWVDDAFLEENGVTSWGEMPAWIPEKGLNHASNTKAIAAGMTFRPIAETIRDTWEWMKAQPPSERPARAGMTAEREAELLQKWHARGR